MDYSINPEVEQNSITAYLRAEYPAMKFFEDGIPADSDDDITFDSKDRINTFGVLWYSNPKPGSKKGFGGRKLDSYIGTVDVAVIASDGTRARIVLNDITDRLIDFKPEGGGRLSQGTSLFSDSRQVKTEANRPVRYMRTNRFDFGIASKHTP